MVRVGPVSYPTDFVFSGACRANFEEEFIGGAADLSFSDSALSLHDNPWPLIGLFP